MATIQRKCARVGQVILFRRLESPYWYIKYPMGIREIKSGKNAGKTKRKYRVESSGQTQLRQAQLIAQEIDLKLFRGNMGLSTGRISLTELRERFLEYQGQDTDNRYRHLRDLKALTHIFVNWATTKGIHLASVVTLETAELFIRHLRYDRDLQDRTIKNYVTAIGGMFAWAKRRQPPLVDSNPFATGRHGQLKITSGPANTKSKEERYETYTPEQVQALIKTAVDEGDIQTAQIITVLAETGMRFGELQFLTPVDIDWRRGTTHIGMKQVASPLHPNLRRLLDRHGRWWPKDETDRYVIMTPTCYKVMEQVAPPATQQAWVFVNDQGMPIQDQDTREQLQKYATEAGVMPIVPNRGKHAGEVWSRANWKMFRNYFVSRAAASGMSFIHVMAATGHDSYHMVLHYFRLNEDAYRNDFKKFDSGLTGVDLTCRELTQAGNTAGTHLTSSSLASNNLGVEHSGPRPDILFSLEGIKGDATL